MGVHEARGRICTCGYIERLNVASEEEGKHKVIRLRKILARLLQIGDFSSYEDKRIQDHVPVVSADYFSYLTLP